MEAGLLEPGGVARELDARRRHCLAPHLVGGVDARHVLGYLLLVDVEADHLHVLGELDCQGHAHVAQAHEGQLGLAVKELLINGHRFVPFLSI